MVLAEHILQRDFGMVQPCRFGLLTANLLCERCGIVLRLDVP